MSVTDNSIADGIAFELRGGGEEGGDETHGIGDERTCEKER